MDRDDGVLAIELAGEHRANLAGLHVARKRLEAARQIGDDVLALPGPVEEHAEVVGLLPQRHGQRPVVFEPAPPLQHFLRGGLVLPEIGRGDLRFELGQLAG